MLTNIAVLMRALRKVDEIGHLRAGWNYGAGSSFDSGTVQAARGIVIELATGGALEFEVFPEDEGGIMIAGYRSDDRFEILTLPDGSIEASYEDEAAERLVGASEVGKVLRKRGWQSVRSSGSFTQRITASSSNDTRHLLFGTPKEGFPLLTPVVSMMPGGRYAPISPHFIPQEFEAHHQFSGGFKSLNLLELTS